MKLVTRAAAALVVLGVSAAPAQARIALHEGESVQLTLGGYFRALTAYMAPDTDAVPELVYRIQKQPPPPDELGIAAQVTRIELKLSVLDVMSVEVHNRFYWQLMTNPLPAASGMGMGVGVSVAPNRSLDTQTDILSSSTHLLQHDLDRLALRFFLGGVDLYVGRQAVSWGVSNLFPVADLWTTFSPFDLDNSQKRGVDAIRVVSGFASGAELDVLVVDRGALDEQSGWEDIGVGAKATFYLDFGDVYVAAAKQWEEIGLVAGVTWNLDTVKLRLEALGAYDWRAGEMQLPRVTLGLDWFQSGDLVMGLEGHFNGAGAQADAYEDYGTHLQSSAPLSRGEVYLLGRWYTGAYITYKPHELVTLSTSTMVNLTDPTAILVWSVAYELAQDVDVQVGGFHGLGSGLEYGDGGGLEFGAYGQMFYVQLAAFF